MSFSTMRTRIAVLACAALFVSSAFANDDAPISAQTLFDEAMEASQSGSQHEAQLLYGKSADAFEAEARSDESGGRWFNTGNARLQAGEIGRAIAAFLRAQSLAPADSAILANLDEARRSREAITAPVDPPGVALLAQRWRIVDEPTRAFVAIAGWVCFWCGLCAMLLLDASKVRARGLWKITMTAGALLACLAGATLLGDRFARREDSRAVVISAEVLPRKGNGDSFAAATEAPLHAGAECEIMATRPNWTEISLAGGVRGWVPNSAIERLW